MACAHRRHTTAGLKCLNEISHDSLTHLHFEFAVHAMNFCLQFQNWSCFFFFHYLTDHDLKPLNQVISGANEFGIEMYKRVSVNFIQRNEACCCIRSWVHIQYCVPHINFKKPARRRPRLFSWEIEPLITLYYN